MIDQQYILEILAKYWPYIFFILGAVVITLVFYFLIGSLVELIYDALVKHNVDNALVYGVFLNAFTALVYLCTIYFFGHYVMLHYVVNEIVILFLSLAWCLSIVGINEKFTSTEKFQMIVMVACLLGFLVWWLWGWLPALYMWALVTFFFYVRAKNS